MEKKKVINETLRPNSFSGRYSGTGSDFKIYFDTVEELKEKIDAIVEAKQYLESKLAKVELEVDIE